MTTRRQLEQGDGDLILVADDDAVTRRLLTHHLREAGFRTIAADDGKQAIAQLNSEVAVAIFDLQMPGASGIECLKHAQQRFPDVQVMVISQFGEIKDAVEAMKQGACEYITKPIDGDALIAHVRQALRGNRLARENRQLREAVGGAAGPAPTWLGNSPAALAVEQLVNKVAKLDATVLITGETGTGKSTLARRIHQLGPKARGPFVAVSCATFPADLVESELFGHVKGAFTGAVDDRMGKAEMADGGTLFLDEIGDLPLALQPKLLTFLQERIFQRVGDGRTRKVDVRMIAATHQDLEEKCRQRTFREDLFFRLNVLPIHAPPLRDRGADLPQLIDHLLARIAATRGCAPFALADDARAALLGYTWPGNIRELENVLECASAYCSGSTIERSDLRLKTLDGQALYRSASSLAGLSLEEIEKRAIIETVIHCGGNKRAAARMLGIDEKTIHNKINKFGLFQE